MNDMSNKQYLHRRNGMWSFRRKYPKDVIAILGKEHFNRALGTSDLKEANIKRPMVEIEFNNEIARHRHIVKPQETREATDAELVGLAMEWFNGKLKSIEEYCDEEGTSKEANDQIWVEATITEVEAELSIANNELYSSGVEARNMLAKAGLHLAEDSPKFFKLQKMFSRGAAEGGKAQQKFANGDYSYKPSDPLFKDYATYVPPKKETISTISLKDLIEAYKEDMKSKWRSPATAIKYEQILNCLGDIIGQNKAIHSIDRAMCREARDVIQKLPTHQNKRPELVGKSPRQTAKLNDKLDYPLLAPRTVNDYLGRLSALFQWAINEHLLERNPALDLGITDDVKAKDKRKPFSTSSLQAIFNAPIYTGSKDDERGYAFKGPNIIKRGRFWVPLLSLWSGMRLNECCQLHVNDIVNRDGIDVILINDEVDDENPDETKRIKTKAGNRYVPIHPELIKLGFMEYVKSQSNAQGVRLFPELKKSTDGYYSNPFSKWFSSFLENCNAKEDNTSFHSFRHNYRDALREADVPIEKAKALGGWSQGNDTSDNYGSGYKSNTLYDEIIKVEYEGLDLRHLYI